MPKRRRAPTDQIDVANGKTDDQFLEEYLKTPANGDRDAPAWTLAWTHPSTDQKYTLGFSGSGNLGRDELEACFQLVAETSEQDYTNSSSKSWKPAVKRREMKSPELRYILVRDGEGTVRGFTSLMPTYEEGQPVIYCYEIHLKPELRGTGLSRLLIGFHITAAQNVPSVAKVMLTCFLSNARALEFYKKMGFEKDGTSPTTRKLRNGSIEPDFVIMSRKVDSVARPS